MVWKQQAFICIYRNVLSRIGIQQIFGKSKAGVWVDVKGFAILAPSGVMESHT